MAVNDLITLLKGRKIYIQTHNSPDPDAIASAYGLQQLLKFNNIDSTICCYGNIDKLNAKRMLATFEIEILSKDEISKIEEDDYIITVDCQKYNTNLTDLVGREIACIDHHPIFVECDYEYKDIRIVGACSSIIAQYFYSTNTPITTNTATALIYGIKIDTCEFTRGVTNLDIDMFAYLFKVADKERLALMYTKVIEFKDLKAYGAAIENIEINEKLGFAYIPFDCPDALIGMISDFVLSVDVVELSVVASERRDGIKISVRSDGKSINAGELVKESLSCYGNGGGHHNMAGGFIPKENLQNFGENYKTGIYKLFIEKI